MQWAPFAHLSVCWGLCLVKIFWCQLQCMHVFILQITSDTVSRIYTIYMHNAVWQLCCMPFIRISEAYPLTAVIYTNYQADLNWKEMSSLTHLCDGSFRALRCRVCSRPLYSHPEAIRWHLHQGQQIQTSALQSDWLSLIPHSDIQPTNWVIR